MAGTLPQRCFVSILIFQPKLGNLASPKPPSPVEDKKMKKKHGTQTTKAAILFILSKKKVVILLTNLEQSLKLLSFTKRQWMLSQLRSRWLD